MVITNAVAFRIGYESIRGVEEGEKGGERERVRARNIPPTRSQIRIFKLNATTITVEAQIFIRAVSLIYRSDNKLFDIGSTVPLHIESSTISLHRRADFRNLSVASDHSRLR